MISPWSDPLEAVLRSVHTVVGGKFHPHLYAIGVHGEPKQSLFSDLTYPLDPDDARAIDKFRRRLLLYHEVVHFAQYSSTLFGLDGFRSLNFAWNTLRGGAPWTLPLAFVADTSADRRLLISRIRNLQFFRKQMSWRSRHLQNPGSRVAQVALYGRPSHIMLFEELDDVGYSEATEQIAAIDGANQPRYFLEAGSGERALECNAATLFEGYAFLMELHHLTSAFPTAFSIEHIVQFLNAHEPIYGATTIIYFSIYKLPAQFFILHQAALIDIALMYSSQTVHNLSTFASRAEGADAYVVPFDTFLRACGAARNVQPMRDWDWAEQQRFQDDVCHQLGVPTTRALAEMGIARLEKMGFRDDDETNARRMRAAGNVDLFAPGLQHLFGLKRRLEYGDGFFSEMLKTKMIREFVENAQLGITFYDLNDGRFTSNGIQNLSSICLGTMLDDALARPAIDCPLRQGRPIACPSAGDDDDVFCEYEFPPGTRLRCPYLTVREMLSPGC